jgi:hypothetical protein
MSASRPDNARVTQDTDSGRVEVVRWRAEQGLPVDAASVERAAVHCANPNYSSPGLWFTPEEEQDLDAVDDAVPAVRAYFAEREDEFADLAVGWQDGRRVLRVGIKGDPAKHRTALESLAPPERLILEEQPYSRAEVYALARRVGEDSEQLEAAGIELMEVAVGYPPRVELGLITADPAGASELLRERYGDAVRVEWTEPARAIEAPHPFREFHDDGRALSIFFDLGRNGDRLARCWAEEGPDNVVVHLYVAQPIISGLVGGTVPTQTTILLERSLDERTVIDAFDGQPRPRRTA